MSVNIVQNGELLPIAGKTVPAPTPDYVDEQFNSSKTYSKGMTCIEGNVRYRYKNSTATSGHRPPDTTYWEVLSVAEQLSGIEETETLLYTIDVTPTGSAVSNRQYPSINTSSYKKLKIVCGLYYNNTAFYGIGSQEYNMADFSFIDAAAHPKDLRFFSSYGSTSVICRWTNSNTTMNDVSISTSINMGTVSCKCFGKIYGIK